MILKTRMTSWCRGRGTTSVGCARPLSTFADARALFRFANARPLSTCAKNTHTHTRTQVTSDDKGTPRETSLYIRKGGARKMTTSKNQRLEEQIRAVPGVSNVCIQLLCNQLGLDPMPEQNGTPNVLDWVNVGPVKPAKGRELIHAELAHELQHQTVFSPEKWKQFGIYQVEADHFVQSQGSFFRFASV